MQESDWNCVNLITPNHKKKPFDDPRVRRALALALDQWKGAPALAKIATVHTVGGIVFPGSPLAATKEELEKLPGYWPDIEKSRAEAKRLLKEAGAEGLKFELLNRNIDQPYKYVAAWVIDEWRKIGLNVTQKVVPTGPFYEGLRSGNFDVTVDFNCQGVVNPPLDTAKYLPASVYTENYGQYEDAKSIELYNKMLHEPDPQKQRQLMRDYETYTLDTAAHEIVTPWWYRLIPHQSYMKGWKISPSHYINQNSRNGMARQIAGPGQARASCSRPTPGRCASGRRGGNAFPRGPSRAKRRHRCGAAPRLSKGERRLEFATRLTLAAAFAASVATAPVARRPPNDAETRRHADLYDCGRRAAELRRASRADLCD